MDKLDKIFEMQKALDGYIAENRSLNFTVDEWVQKKCLAMISEISELLCEVNFNGGRIKKKSTLKPSKRKWWIFFIFSWECASTQA